MKARIVKDDSARDFLGVITKLGCVASLSEFRSLVRTHVRKLFPHGSAACGIGQIEGPRILTLVNIDYPIGYLSGMIRPDRSVRSHLLDAWLSRQTPTCVAPKHKGKKSEFRLARQFKLENMALHGQMESSGDTFSFFCFAQLGSPALSSHYEILQLLVPHLHSALTRVLVRSHKNISHRASSKGAHVIIDRGGEPLPSIPDSDFTLSRREREVLYWVQKGKTNWEIAQILNLSEHTAKNHVRNILKKLGVANRVQAAVVSPSLVRPRADVPAPALLGTTHSRRDHSRINRSERFWTYDSDAS